MSTETETVKDGSLRTGFDEKRPDQMLVTDFDYELPEELIAQDPLEDRSSSRLMVLDPVTGEVTHRIFREITKELRPGDTLG